MDFEAINLKTGGCGTYQYIAFFLLSVLTFKMAADFQSFILALYEPEFQCDISNISIVNKSNIIISKNQCQYKLNNNSIWNNCEKFVYNRSVLDSSLVTDFDFVCDRSIYSEILTSVFFASSIFSLPLIILADKYGRKKMLVICLIIIVLLSIWQIFLQTTAELFITMFLTGFIKSIYVGLAFTTLVELTPIDYIEMAAANFWLFYAIGYMASSIFAYFTRNWRHMYALSLVLSGFYAFYPCLIPETPRWLMLHGKREKAYKVIGLIAKINRCKLSRNDFEKWKPIQEPTGQILALFKYKSMIVRFAVLIFAAWAFSFAYVGVSTDLTFASKNIFLTTFVMGAVELPTGPLAAIVAKRTSRKTGISIFCIIGTVCLIILPFIESDLSKSYWEPWLKVSLAIGGKLGFTSAWSIFDVYTNELMPTTERNSGMSIVYIVVAGGSTLAPLMNRRLAQWHYTAPCMVYASFLIGTIILVMLLLPETKGIPLPQTIHEAVSLQRGKEAEWKEIVILDAKRRGTVDLTINETVII